MPTDFRSVYQETISELARGRSRQRCCPSGPFPEISRYDSGTGSSTTRAACSLETRASAARGRRCSRASLLAAASLGRGAHPSKPRRVATAATAGASARRSAPKPRRPRRVTTVTSTSTTDDQLDAHDDDQLGRPRPQPARRRPRPPRSSTTSSAAALPHGTQVDERATGRPPR